MLNTNTIKKNDCMMRALFLAKNNNFVIFIFRYNA